MRIVDQPLAQIAHERAEGVFAGGGPGAGRAVTGQIPPDGLAVVTEMPGDRRHRPSLPGQNVHVHVVLLV